MIILTSIAVERMDRALLQSAMDRWAGASCRTRSELISRRYLPALPGNDMALAISGVRRSGKTTLSLQLSKDFPESKVLYYNFEDPLFLNETDPSGIELLVSIFEQTRGYSPELIILDEIQNVPGWERWVRSAVDQRRAKIIVTGSNAKLLSADLATSLTGRSLEHITWPLSLSEVQNFLNKKDRTTGETLNRSFYLQKLLSWGGMPAALLIEDDASREKLLRQYLSDIVHRDIINRRSIRNKRALDQLLTFYQTNLSSLHSYSAIKKAFGIPVDTVAEYTAALKEAFLIFEVERYHPNLKTQARDPRKIYVIDSGLRRVAARSPEADIGKLLENLVYLELRRTERTPYYYQQEGEVDFIVTADYEPVEAIQVCAYGMDKPETRKRELSALVACMNSLGLSDGTIVTMDRSEIIEVSGKIIHSVAAPEWFV